MWGWLRYALSLLLIATAGTKVAAADQLLHSGGLLSTPLMIAIAVAFEVVAAGIICLAKPRLAYWFAVATFATLTVIAGASWWFVANCNCFGPRTMPGLPLIVDLICLLGLVVSYRSSRRTKPTWLMDSRRHWRVATLLVIGVAIPMSGSVLVAARTANRATKMPAWFGENLIGKSFPLLRDQRVTNAVPRDTTVFIVFLRPECEHCQQLAMDWKRETRELKPNAGLVGVSMLPSSWTFIPGSLSITSPWSPSTVEVRWDDEREPVVEAPTLMVVHNGTVVDVHTGDDVLAQLLQWSSRS